MCHIISLDNVQRRYLKFLAFRVDGAYALRGTDQVLMQQRFNFDSLQLKRSMAGLSFLYKLCHNLIDAPNLLAKINFSIPKHNLRQTSTFYCKFSRTNMLLNSPINVMCSNFNSISNSCDLNIDRLSTILNDYKF